MLARRFPQLAVVDDHGKLVDLLSYRDIVAAEARREMDGNPRPQPCARSSKRETISQLRRSPVIGVSGAFLKLSRTMMSLLQL